MNEPDVLTSLAGMFVLGIGSQWIASRIRLPSILLLLTAGVIAGPVLQWINPDKLLGNLVLPIVSLSIAVILFEGSMSLRLSDLKAIGRPLAMLLTVGVLVTWALSTIAGFWILNFPFSVSLLLGSILTVTGPTVIGPMLRDIRPTGSTGPIARWEGIVIDPIGAVLAVLVYGAQEALLRGDVQNAATSAIQGFLGTMFAGSVVGLLLSVALLQLLARHWVPDHLQSPFTLAVVIGGFTASNLLSHESGLVAVTVMGLLLANQKRVPVRHIFEFKESLSVLLISSLFILLTARLNPVSLLKLGWRGIGFVTFLILVVRPACVWISTIGCGLKKSERIFLSWLAPRGIVAAAVASVFALEMQRTSLPAEEFAAATFMVIIGTVIVYGLTAGILARKLGLSSANPQGILIASGHPGARAIAVALVKEKIPVVLVDKNAQNLSVARMEGLNVFHADILSEAMHHEIDLGGIGRFLALTPNVEVNSIAARRFSELFGRAETYRLSSPTQGHDRRKIASDALFGRVAFSENATYEYLDRRFESGAVIKRTRLTDEFDFDDFRAMYGPDALVLFVLDETGRLSITTTDREITYRAGQTLFALTDLPPEQLPAAEDSGAQR
ncbi:MAG: cation:proton antiporter [Planctomycetaceae bacterium]